MTGQLIGNRYEIVSRIGKGGMASVYRAKDTRLLRQVAVKLLAMGGDSEGLFYFHREARAIAALRHNNIVQIYDYSGPDENPAFIVMEIIEGGNVDEVLMVRHPLPEAVIVAAAHGVALALQHAHDHGVIHRDIKPANVMVEKTGRLLLTDFGIAKAYADESLLGNTLSGQRTQLFGTPDFMAPEQITEQALGPHTDVFALGSLIYCLATNVSPFDHGDTVEVLRRVVDVEYTRLRGVRPELSPELEALIDGCLQASVGARPVAGAIVERCEELLLAHRISNAQRGIQRFLNGESPASDAASFAAARQPAPSEPTASDDTEPTTPTKPTDPDRDLEPTNPSKPTAPHTEHHLGWDDDGPTADQPVWADDPTTGEQPEWGEWPEQGDAQDPARWSGAGQGDTRPWGDAKPDDAASTTIYRGSSPGTIAVDPITDPAARASQPDRTTIDVGRRRSRIVGAVALIVAALGGAFATGMPARLGLLGADNGAGGRAAGEDASGGRPGSPGAAARGEESATRSADAAPLSYGSIIDEDGAPASPTPPSDGTTGASSDLPGGPTVAARRAVEADAGASGDPNDEPSGAGGAEDSGAAGDDAGGSDLETTASDAGETDASDGDATSRSQRKAKRRPKPRGNGSLTITVSPWGTVSIDGVEKGNTPMVRKVSVSAGKHAITVTHPQFGTHKKVTTVRPGQNTTVTFDLRKK